MPSQRHRYLLLASFLVSGTLLYCLLPHIFYSQTQLPVPHSCATKILSINSSQNSNNQTTFCTPKVDIMFMKTHKSASSTFLNILFRFGEKHGLRFALPNSRNDFFYPSFFQRTQVYGYRPGTCFNIICNHMRFNGPEVAEVMPLDTFYITILRDPAELFESAFHYFKNVVPLTWGIPGNNKMETFLQKPNVYYDQNSYNSFYLKNLQFFDLGHDNTLDPNEALVNVAITDISERFHFVMLAEYFEESLILLREALCWEMDDLRFFKLNTRMKSTVSKMTPELRANALQWNGIDWKLYQYFNTTFWEKVEAYGIERMAEDVRELKRRNAKMENICIEGGHAVEASNILEAHMQPWQPLGEKSILGYNLKNNIDEAYIELCRKMVTPEIQYMTELGVNLWLTKLWGHVRSIINW